MDRDVSEAAARSSAGSKVRNVAIEYRWAEGRAERFTEIAAEFVRLKVDVIVTAGTEPVHGGKAS